MVCRLSHASFSGQWVDGNYGPNPRSTKITRLVLPFFAALDCTICLACTITVIPAIYFGFSNHLKNTIGAIILLVRSFFPTRIDLDMFAHTNYLFRTSQVSKNFLKTLCQKDTPATRSTAKKLIASGNIAETITEVLLDAAKEANCDALSWWKEQGADLSRANAQGRTPLIEAILLKDDDYVKVSHYLLNCNVNVRNGFVLSTGPDNEIYKISILLSLLIHAYTIKIKVMQRLLELGAWFDYQDKNCLLALTHKQIRLILERCVTIHDIKTFEWVLKARKFDQEILNDVLFSINFLNLLLVDAPKKAYAVTNPKLHEFQQNESNFLALQNLKPFAELLCKYKAEYVHPGITSTYDPMREGFDPDDMLLFLNTVLNEWIAVENLECWEIAIGLKLHLIFHLDPIRLKNLPVFPEDKQIELVKRFALANKALFDCFPDAPNLRLLIAHYLLP